MKAEGRRIKNRKGRMEDGRYSERVWIGCWTEGFKILEFEE